MLLAMSEGDAARVLADCPPRLCGALLQGIAAERPTMAATILGLLRPVTAGHAFAYLRLETAASLIVAMVQSEAQRILEAPTSGLLVPRTGLGEIPRDSGSGGIHHQCMSDPLIIPLDHRGFL